MINIETTRLRLVPLTTASGIRTNGVISKIVGWLNDGEVVRYSEQRHRTHTTKSQFDYMDSFRYPDKLYLILNNDNPIGTISARVDAKNSVADMGILIGEKEEWGKGYGTEAWNALMHKLFDNGTRKVEAGCMRCNTGMKKIFKKSGMHEESNRQNHFILEEGKDLKFIDLSQWARFFE